MTHLIHSFRGFVIGLAITFFAIPSAAWAQESGKDPQRPSQPDASAAVDASVWGALVYGGPDERPFAGETPDEFAVISGRLKKVFDHAHFSLLGHHTQDIFREYESWVVPSKDLFLKIDSKGQTAEGDGLRIHLQVWQGKKVLVKTDATLMSGSPLFIGGPRWGEGRLFFVLKLIP